MNPLHIALIDAARAFIHSLETNCGSSGFTPPPATTPAVAAPKAKVTPKPEPAATPKPAPAPEPVKEPEPEVTFDEEQPVITLESLKAKFKPLVQHADTTKRKEFQSVVGKWMLDHGAKSISEVKADDYIDFDAFLTKTGESA